jgi:uncharacterized repeat protein (TIGR03943 family)
MTLDWSRIARGLALGAWGAFFVYLLVSGRSTTYIGPKTAWVVTVGALLLPLIALAHLAGARGHKRAPSNRELGGLTLLVAPIILAIMVPAPSLGALAVANKRGRNAPAPQGAPVDGRIRLYEIAWAGESAKYASNNAIKAGQTVDFTGFVSKRAANGGPMEVSRFFVTCCAADAVAYSVKVKLPDGATALAADTWVRVQGTLAGRPGSSLTVAARTVDEIEQPANPYS